MPIQIIPAPQQIDPMQQLASLYDMYTAMQMAPLKMQQAQNALAQQGLEAEQTRQSMDIARQDAASRKSDQAYQESQRAREASVQSAKGARMMDVLDLAVKHGQMTPEQATANRTIAELGDPTLLPPEAQAIHFKLQMVANPMAKLEYDEAQKRLQKIGLEMEESRARINKLNTTGSTGDAKDAIDAFDKLFENYNKLDDQISKAKIEASPAGALKRAEQRWADEKGLAGGSPYELDGKGNVKMLNGKPVQKSEFSGMLAKEMAANSGYEIRAKNFETMRDGLSLFVKDNLPQFTPYFSGAFGGKVTAPPAGARLQTAASALATIAQTRGPADALAIATGSLKLQPGALFDASFEAAFPADPSEDPGQRAALKGKIKAILDYQPPKGPSPSAGTAYSTRGS